MSRGTTAWIAVSWLVVSLAAAGLPAADRDGEFNGGFEDGLDPAGMRPAHWLIGFPDDLAPRRGSWRLVEEEGSTVLELTAEAGEGEGFLAVQIVDLPAAEMSGRTVRVHGRVRPITATGWTGLQVAALNPEAQVDPELGFAHVGSLHLTAAEAGWQELSGEIELNGPAELIVVVLFALGDGTSDAGARFDRISVAATDLERPGCGAWDALPLAGGQSPFPLGVVNENPRNGSDRALSDLVARTAEIADLVNLFAHVRWNGLSGDPLLAGHERVLAGARQADALGLDRMLTLDFTHAALEGLGDINPRPDGTPVDRLDETARAAYVDELEALVEAVGASLVSVGIETDFFLGRHHEQWGDYRAMLCSARDRLRARWPGIHVTTYFTLETLVHPDLAPNGDGQQAMRELLPCIDSVGFSYYPADGVHHLEAIPPGMMIAAAAVGPGLPLIVPEFGYRGGDQVYSEEEQEAFLRRALAELAGHPVVAAVWFSLYDQSYLGAAPFFQDAFRTIGLIRRDGAPKRALTLLARTRSAAGPTPPRHPRPWCGPEPRPAGGRRDR